MVGSVDSILPIIFLQEDERVRRPESEGRGVSLLYLCAVTYV
jgi:hypothetical protein